MITLTQTNSEKTVNLGNVSCITLEAEKNKVIFNFMNPINKFGRDTPDYAYFVYNSPEEAINAYTTIKEIAFIKQNFLFSTYAGNKTVVNKNSINTISERETQLNLIFNLNFSVTNENNHNISKSVFWTYPDEDSFEADKLLVDAAIEARYII